MRRLVAAILTVVAVLAVSCDGVRPSAPIPAGKPGATSALIGTASYGPEHSDGVGAFRINCAYSHANYSDPILYPGQPFRSHLHAFFGNDAVNHTSTATSIATTGGSTCTGGTANRTAYWVPALIDTGGQPWRSCTGTDPHPACTMVAPGASPTEKPTDPDACTRNYWGHRWCVDVDNAAQFYYKTGYRGVASADVQTWPEGLRMIAGNAKTTTAQPLSDVWWTCKGGHGDGGTGKHPSIAATGCRAGQLLVMAVEFPQCWNGRDLDSPDHRSHMAYPLGWPDLGCPTSHPVPLPAVTSWTYYRLPAGVQLERLRLASDMHDGPPGISAHADWWNGWDPDVFASVVDNCYQPGLDCRMNLLGDGRVLTGPG